ncbi:MAG: hypothetical protein J3Q66DRAFT_322378 [Benniella sp.]|nr:MAG: hypothetical protein J3Q66DRAFT_322378 [Benniella sp.]
MSSLTLLLARCSPLRSVFSPVSLAPIYFHYTPVTQDPSGSLFLCRTTLIWLQRTFRTNVVRQDGVLTSAREQMLGHILPRVNWSSFLYLLWFLLLPYEDAPGAIVDIASIITFNLFAQLFNMASYILMASMTLEDSGLEDDRGVRHQVHKEFENRGLWIGTFVVRRHPFIHTRQAASLDFIATPLLGRNSGLSGPLFADIVSPVGSPERWV